jgi:cell division protein FtsQ
MWHDVRMLNAATGALLGVLMLCLLASGVWWIAQRPMFTLKVIRIEGAGDMHLRYMNPSTVRTTALPRIKGNFFTADLETVRIAFEAVPWVGKATVRREWPDRLIVRVEEHRALGKWGNDGRLLSTQGDVFTANMAEAEEDGELPEFGGPDNSAKEVAALYHQLQDWLKPAGLVPESVQLSDRYAWTLALTNGMRVELGREQSTTTLKGRVDRLIGIYPQLAMRLQGGIESVDMRYPNGLALKATGLAFGLEERGAARRN